MKRNSICCSLPAFFLILISVLFSVIYDASAQTEEKDSRGKDFWFTFIPNLHVNRPQTDSLYIFISATEATNGTISYRGRTGNWNTVQFSITDPSTIYQLPLFWQNWELQGQYSSPGYQTSGNNQAEIPANNSFHIIADREVSVYALNQASTTSDAFIVLPTDALGKDHYVLAYNSDANNNNGGNTPSEFAVVATENNTQISILPSIQTSRSNSKNPISVILNQGQSYLVQSSLLATVSGGYGDLTGSRVQSDKPIALFAGHQRATIPVKTSDLRSRDHIVEQIPSVESWGRTALVVPYPQPNGATLTAQDIYRVIAAYDSTDIIINGKKTTTLNSGGMYESVLVSSQSITSNKAILVAQYKKTSGTNTTNFALGDPFMMLVPPSEQYQKFYRFINVQAVNYSNGFEELRGYSDQWITVIMPNTAIGKTLLDNKPVSSYVGINIVPINGTKYSYTWVPVQDGNHTVESSEPVGIFVYGYGSANSYGYVGGMSFRSFDFNPPQITGKSECKGFIGAVFDTVAGDTRIVSVSIPKDSLINCTAQDIPQFSEPQDSVQYSFNLINPYLDGSARIIAIDSVDQKTEKKIVIKGFTVSTKIVDVTNIPEKLNWSLPIGRKQCYSIELENYGSQDQTINPMMSDNTLNYYSFSGSFPLTLKPGQKSNIDVCFESKDQINRLDTMYLSNSCINRPLIEFTIRTYDDKYDPVIVAQSDSCNSCFLLSITDSTINDGGLLSVSQIDAQNIQWNIPANISPLYRVLTACIVDPFKDAVYAIQAVDNNGNSTIFRDTIPGFTLQISAMKNPEKLKGLPIGINYCDSVSIKNNGNFIQTIEYSQFKKNVQFSVPISQFPIVLNPKDQKSIVFCYNPIKVADTLQYEKDTDTLFFGRDCVSLPLPFEGFAIDDNHLTKAKCSVDIIIGIVKIQQPGLSDIIVFPNPISVQNNAATLQFTLGSKQDISLDIFSPLTMHKVHMYDGVSSSPGQYTIEVPIQELHSGFYYFMLKAGPYSEFIPISIY